MGLRVEDDELNVDILYLKCLQVSSCAKPGDSCVYGSSELKVVLL